MATNTAPKPKRYDPGAPTWVRPIAAGRYAVGSFRDGDQSYEVDLADYSCSCPHFTYRCSGRFDENGPLVCKHIELVEQYDAAMRMVSQLTPGAVLPQPAAPVAAMDELDDEIPPVEALSEWDTYYQPAAA